MPPAPYCLPRGAGLPWALHLNVCVAWSQPAVPSALRAVLNVPPPCVCAPCLCVRVCACVCSWVRRAELLPPGHTSHPEPPTAPVPSSSPGAPTVFHGAGRCPLGCIAFVSHFSVARGMTAGWGGPCGVTGANWCYLNASEPFWRRAQSRAGSGQRAGPPVTLTPPLPLGMGKKSHSVPPNPRAAPARSQQRRQPLSSGKCDGKMGASWGWGSRAPAAGSPPATK